MFFTRFHEWIDVQGDIATVGITSLLQNELGEIVYVELPEMGKEVEKDAPICVLESTKAAADLYAPISGTVVAVNRALEKEISLLMRDPEKEGWLFQMKIRDPQEFETLLTPSDYKALL